MCVIAMQRCLHSIFLVKYLITDYIERNITLLCYVLLLLLFVYCCEFSQTKQNKQQTHHYYIMHNHKRVNIFVSSNNTNILEEAAVSKTISRYILLVQASL